MTKAAIVVGGFYKNNRLFDLLDTVSNRDQCLSPFVLLKQTLEGRGIALATSDIHKPDQSALVLYLDMPFALPTGKAINKSVLLLFESEVIRPDNWRLDKHQHFAKIFTWHDQWVDNVKYFKMNFAVEWPRSINKDLAKKQKFCALIAGGHKHINHALELYSKRVEAIRWFERHHPRDFDLYGMGWNRYRFTGPRIVRALNRIRPLTKFLAPLAPKFPSYRGAIEGKKPVLEQYKFAICYENARDIPGYITEKIFDCFLAGCVPIYWGANNIDQHIPRHCFIDKTAFEDYADLYQFLRNMSDAHYVEYLRNIERFLNSEKAAPFSSQHFVDTLIGQICR